MFGVDEQKKHTRRKLVFQNVERYKIALIGIRRVYWLVIFDIGRTYVYVLCDREADGTAHRMT